MMQNSRFPVAKDQPQGMILAFALMIMALASLMGAMILASTRTELSIAGNNRVGREAFNAADASARVAILLTRALVHPELGDPAEALSRRHDGPAQPLTVEINDSRFNLLALLKESNERDFAKRYLEVADRSGDFETPHLTFKIKDREVAFAVVNLATDEPIPAGMSQSVLDRYDAAGGANIEFHLVITVNGVSMAPYEGSAADVPHSIITTIFRDAV
ncbi:MAG: pilus assembly PilX N-terminal domain-containing protein [Deltaproteobacteria bacterium]|jgi:hypothetical protein|nr:pilus assembly PilX N-terminal domain-containing protein [Deltaproteobacteria bacterium]